MPFITDEIYNNLPKTSGSIMVSDWAKCDKAYENARYVEAMERIMELIRAIRNIRAEMNVPPSRKTSITVVVKEEDEEICVEASKYIARLCGGENIIVQTGKEGIQKDAVSVVTKFAEAYMPFEQLVDLKQERERLAKEIAFVESEVKRAEGKLNNSGFVDKAPPEVVEAEREKLKSNSEMLIKLKEKLLSLQ